MLNEHDLIEQREKIQNEIICHFERSVLVSVDDYFIDDICTIISERFEILLSKLQSNNSSSFCPK